MGKSLIILLIFVVSAQDAFAQTSARIVLQAHCFDVYNGEWIQAKVSAVTAKGLVSLGQSDERGNIRLRIPDHTKSLKFTAAKYHTDVLPLNIDPGWTGNIPIPLNVGLIQNDSLLVIKKYKSVQALAKVRTADFDPKRFMLVRLYDPAASHLTGITQVCITYPKSNITECHQATIDGDPILVEIKERNNIILEAKAGAGFGSYRGVIKEVSSEKYCMYEIGLYRSNTFAYYVRPDSVKFEFKFISPHGRHATGKIVPGNRKRGDSRIIYAHVGQEGKYTFQFQLNPNGRVIEYPVDIRDGFNFKVFDLARENFEEAVKAAQVPTLSLVSKSQIDSTLHDQEQIDSTEQGKYRKRASGNYIAYFDQSQYELRLETKVTLDSVAARFMGSRNSHLQITGHTDNVGEMKLNLALSEYRARMVSTYLRNKGVPEDHLIVNWKGNDNAVSDNTDEIERAKNRRVEIKFIE